MQNRVFSLSQCTLSMPKLLHYADYHKRLRAASDLTVPHR